MNAAENPMEYPVHFRPSTIPLLIEVGSDLATMVELSKEDSGSVFLIEDIPFDVLASIHTDEMIALVQPETFGNAYILAEVLRVNEDGSVAVRIFPEEEEDDTPVIVAIFQTGDVPIARLEAPVGDLDFSKPQVLLNEDPSVILEKGQEILLSEPVTGFRLLVTVVDDEDMETHEVGVVASEFVDDELEPEDILGDSGDPDATFAEGGAPDAPEDADDEEDPDEEPE